MDLAVWANFGPLWLNISQEGLGTLTFYWLLRLYILIGIEIALIFVGTFFPFLTWVKISMETCAFYNQNTETDDTSMESPNIRNFESVATSGVAPF